MHRVLSSIFVTMNRILNLTLTACTLGFFAPVHAQITYGLQQNVIPWQEGLYLAGYEVLSDTWIWADTLEYAEGFGLGSSTYDHWEDDYVFLGLPSGSLGALQWMEHPVDGITPPFLSNVNGVLHSIHHDMQSNTFYGLQGYGLDSTWVDFGDGNGYWEINNWATQVVSISPDAGEVSLDVVLQLPWLEGVVAGASCFDSDTHRFFIWGIDNQGNGRLVAVDCESATVASDVSPELASNQNVSELEYNILDGMLLGLRSNYLGNGNADMELISLDPATGDITSQLDLPQVGSYTPDGTVFDQLNRIFILHYYQGSGLNSRILSVDAGTMDILTDVALDANFLELEMSNALFASQRYATVDIPSPQATGVAMEMGQWVHRGAEPCAVEQFDRSGRLVSHVVLSPGDVLPVPRGFWIWEFTQGDAREAHKTFRR